MRATQHTPGPWHVDNYEPAFASHKTYIYSGTPGTSRTAVASIMRHAESEANARLIAAAPELLAALMLITHNDTCNCDTCGIARAAIAKAVQS